MSKYRAVSGLFWCMDHHSKSLIWTKYGLIRESFRKTGKRRKSVSFGQTPLDPLAALQKNFFIYCLSANLGYSYYKFAFCDYYNCWVFKYVFAI